MKKFRLQAVALVLVVTAAFTSCSKDDDNDGPVTKTAFVTTVTGPTTGTINQELVMAVAFTVDNNCGSFNKFVETSVTNTKTIEVQAKYEGTNCGTTATVKNTTYKFKATAAGTYILKFKKSATEFVTQTVVVN